MREDFKKKMLVTTIAIIASTSLCTVLFLLTYVYHDEFPNGIASLGVRRMAFWIVSSVCFAFCVFAIITTFRK